MATEGYSHGAGGRGGRVDTQNGGEPHGHVPQGIDLCNREPLKTKMAALAERKVVLSVQ